MEKIILVTKANNREEVATQTRHFFYDLEGNRDVIVEYYSYGGLIDGILVPMISTFRKMVTDKLVPEFAPNAIALSDEILEQYKEWLEVTWKSLGGEGQHCYIPKTPDMYKTYHIQLLKECKDIVSKYYEDPVEKAYSMEEATFKISHDLRITSGNNPDWKRIGQTKIDAGKLLAGHFMYKEPYYNMRDYNYKWPKGDLDLWWAVEIDYE